MPARFLRLRKAFRWDGIIHGSASCHGWDRPKLRLMGHANEAITGSIYTHEVTRRDNAERTRATMRAAFASRDRGLVLGLLAELGSDESS